MFKVNNKDTGAFIVIVELISHLFLVCLLLTFSMHLFAGLKTKRTKKH